MSNAAAHGDIGVSQQGRGPVCQWSFNRAHQFHHVSGDSAGLFHRPAAGLLRQHVSVIDDAQRSWSTGLDRLFSGETHLEQWTAASPAGEHALFHLPVRDAGGAVTYVAGFAFPAGVAFSAASGLEWVAVAMLQAVESERTRATRFLHDVVAQSLSGAGLQLELLQIEVRTRTAQGCPRAAGIQQSLEKVLKLIREFNAPE